MLKNGILTTDIKDNSYQLTTGIKLKEKLIK